MGDAVLCHTGTVQPKRYKRRCEQQIGMCIQDLFAPLLQACSQLAAAGENTDKRTREILDQAHAFKNQLADIYDYVTPCFPERYEPLLCGCRSCGARLFLHSHPCQQIYESWVDI